jgi:hypothetical protein
MLDGSLIAFVANETGSPCDDVFVKLALSAKPSRTSNEKSDLEGFAKIACNSQNPDDLWVASFLRTGFVVRVVVQNQKKVHTGEKAISFARDRGTSRASLGEFHVGPIYIDFSEYQKSIPETSMETAMSPAGQLTWLQTLRPKYEPKCGIHWVSCVLLEGRSQDDQAAWSGGRKVLAREAIKLLPK